MRRFLKAGLAKLVDGRGAWSMSREEVRSSSNSWRVGVERSKSSIVRYIRQRRVRLPLGSRGITRLVVDLFGATA